MPIFTISKDSDINQMRNLSNGRASGLIPAEINSVAEAAQAYMIASGEEGLISKVFAKPAEYELTDQQYEEVQKFLNPTPELKKQMEGIVQENNKELKEARETRDRNKARRF